MYIATLKRYKKPYKKDIFYPTIINGLSMKGLLLGVLWGILNPNIKPIRHLVRDLFVLKPNGGTFKSVLAIIPKCCTIL